MTSVEQSESKQNKTSNSTAQASKQPKNVSNSKTNQNLYQVFRPHPAPEIHRK